MYTRHDTSMKWIMYIIIYLYRATSVSSSPSTIPRCACATQKHLYRAKSATNLMSDVCITVQPTHYIDLELVRESKLFRVQTDDDDRGNRVQKILSRYYHVMNIEHEQLMDRLIISVRWFFNTSSEANSPGTTALYCCMLLRIQVLQTIFQPIVFRFYCTCNSRNLK